MSDQPQNIIITGGGLASLAFALSLNKHFPSKANISIYEHRSHSSVSSGHLGLAPNALRVLDHVGVYEAIRTQGYNFDHLVFANSSDGTIGKLLQGSVERYGYLALRVRRSVLRDELMKAVELPENENIKTFYGTGWHCKGVKEETTTSVTVEFDNGETASGDIVVAGDGIHSSVRRHIRPDSEPVYGGSMGIGGSMARSQLPRELMEGVEFPRLIYGPTGFFGIMPLDFDGQAFAYFSAHEYAEPEGKDGWKELDKDKETLGEMIKKRYVGTGWSLLVEAMVERAPQESLWSWAYYQVPRLDSWISQHGRVIIIGDAAHAIPPSGGQGAAMAFEDAETLAYALSKPVESRSEMLQKWQTHRLERVDRITEFTARSGNSRKTWSPMIQWVKEWMIRGTFYFMSSLDWSVWIYEYDGVKMLST